MIPCSQSELDFFDLLQATARFLWKDWPIDMEVSTSNLNLGTVSLRGTCPHCQRPSVFSLIAGLGTAPNSGHRLGVMQCQGCLDFILAEFVQHNHSFAYLKHYPLGNPDQRVAVEIPAHIAEDFKEALRCLHVSAWNATAEMCRRAVEAGCIDRGAPAKLKVLEDKIDWLADNQKITPDLRDAAHKVRLGGNRGAHPPEYGPKSEVGIITDENAPVEIIEEEHARAIVDFTRHFFQYVYVIPKQLDKYDFSKPKAARPA